MMLEVLKALQKARDYVAAQPPLVAGEEGEGVDDNGKPKKFYYPHASALRALCEAAFKEACFLDATEDIKANGVLRVTFALYLMEGPTAGADYRLEMEWPIDVTRSMSRPHATVAALSHAWRHAMMQLLRVKTVPLHGVEPGETPWSPAEREQAAQLDALVGEAPPWAGMPPAAAMFVQQDAQWEAVGAVVDGEPPHDEDGVCLDAPAVETPDVTLYSLWLSLRDTPKAKRWTGLAHAFREFSGDDKAQRIEESPEFKQWLQVQVSEAA